MGEPRRSISNEDNVFTAPFVAMGMKNGVSKTPCGVINLPRRAWEREEEEVRVNI
jgi:hypothetical protein